MGHSIRAWLRGDVGTGALTAVRSGCIDAYDRIDGLPRGAAREAAWAAYAFLTYGDKLVASVEKDGYLDRDTARLAASAFELSAGCLAGAVPAGFPRWSAGTRSERQLRGIRDALDALRTFLAFDLQSRHDDTLAARLAAVDDRLHKVDSLLVSRPTAELRGGIGDALSSGLDDAYALGRAMAVAAD